MKVYTTVPKVNTTSDIDDKKNTESQIEEIIPVVGDEVLLGNYPQRLVTDSDITAELAKLAGKLPNRILRRKWKSYGYYIKGKRQNFMWYIDVDYQQTRYRGVYFTSYRPNQIDHDSSMSKAEQDDNGYMTNVVYWFRYEPIRWRVVEVLQYGMATLVSEDALDSVHYYGDGRGYVGSYIRGWLNKNFYSVAFDRAQGNAIIMTTVDNSESGEKDTQNKVYLLSKQEACNKYKVSAKTSTDYAKSQGCWTNEKGKCCWWLRSFSKSAKNKAHIINATGAGDTFEQKYIHVGVVPVVKIKL